MYEENLVYNVAKLALKSGELSLIEVVGLVGPAGSILLTPNAHRVAEDCSDCFWLDAVTNCAGAPELQEPVRKSVQFPWQEVVKVQHDRLDVNIMTQPMKMGRRPICGRRIDCGKVDD